MASTIPKHHSTRSRRNNPKAGFTQLPASVSGLRVPSWPLPADMKVSVGLEMADDKVATLQVEIAKNTDPAAHGRLSRSLNKALQLAEMLRLQSEQQRDLESSLWATLWGSPQAQLWEVSPAFERMLAQFVRWNVKGEQGDLEAAKEARQRGAEFGLTPKTLMVLRAEIERAEEAEEKTTQRRARKAKPKDDPRSQVVA